MLLAISEVQARRVRVYNLHKGPGMKFGIIGRVRAGDPVEVLEEKAGWVKIRSRKGKVGWISQRLFQRGWRHEIKKAKAKKVRVLLEFQNIPKACVESFRRSLDVLSQRLTPVGDDEVEVVVSAVPRLRSFRLFLIIDFNPKYYRRKRKRFTQPGTIDLLPYNGCIWAMYAYKQALIREMEKKGSPCAFVKRLSICLVLRKLSGEEIILQTVEDGVYIYFSPVMVMKRADGFSFRFMSEDPKKVGILSAFTLPYPLTGGSREASEASAIYRFFRAKP